MKYIKATILFIIALVLTAIVIIFKVDTTGKKKGE